MFEGDHFAYRHNYMDLDPGYKDKFGDPLLRMTLDWTDHERSQEQFFLKIQRELAADTRLRIIKAATCKAARS